MKILEQYRQRLLLVNQRTPYKREIFNLCYDTLKRSNLCLIGLRQIGKTTLMEQVALQYYENVLKQECSTDCILYINLKNFLDEEDKIKKKEQL